VTRGLNSNVYALELNLASTGGVARSFQVLSNITSTLESMDRHLATSADVLVETILVLEGIEYGSIRVLLKTVLESIDDEGIKELDIKKVIGGYLLKAKYKLIKMLSDKPHLDRLQVVELQTELIEAAEESGISRLPGYSQPRLNQVSGDIEKMQQALEPLEYSDRLTYISPEGRADFNQSLKLLPGSLDKLLTKETLVHTNEMILRVKKMDLLGDSQWEFRYNNRSIHARIVDNEWLQRFRSRQEPVLSGDSLRVMVDAAVSYGFDNEVLKTRYLITQVLEVLPSNEIQGWLGLDGDI